MDRYTQYDQEQVRTFDQNWLTKDAMIGLSRATGDLLGATYTVVNGFAGTATGPASLVVNIAAGDIYQYAATDSTGFGSLPSDSLSIQQQGFLAASALTLTTAALSAGQSQWVLIAASFTQADAIRTNDPTGGLLYYYNSSNPSQPFQGPGNDGLTQPTVRLGTATIDVVYGTPATSGSQVPPSVPTGFVPLYLILLAFGQTTIVNNQILVSAPSVGVGVPSNYPYAPFLAGLLHSHHSGTPGQAPKINLVTEVQGVLPFANMAPVRQLLAVNLDLYVNRATGSDANSGLSSGAAWATLQHAWNFIVGTLDLSIYVVTVHIADDGGTPYGPFTAVGQVVGGGGATSVIFLGNTTTPTNCRISSTVASCILADVGAKLFVRGIGFSTTGGFDRGILSQNGAFVQFDTCDFGASGAAQLETDNGGIIACTDSGAYTISGDAPGHLLANTGLITMKSPAVLLSSPRAFGSGFATSNDAGQIKISGAVYTGTATGRHYTVTMNSIIDTAGGGPTYFPGDAAGVATSGGQYA